MLAINNAHPRDQKIKFDEATHTYTIDDQTNYKSVTTLIHDYFPKFNADKVIDKMMNGRNWNADNKYFTMTREEIKALWSSNKEAADLGTKMHNNIENYYNNQPFDDDFLTTKEYQMFRQFVDDYGFQPYRTEWRIYTKKYKIAGSVDIVFRDPDDDHKFILADWKRVKNIQRTNNFREHGTGVLKNVDHCNFWHYTLQLNVYRMILENYYNMTISEMFLIVLHPEKDEYEKIDIARVDDLIIAIFDERFKNIK